MKGKATFIFLLGFISMVFAQESQKFKPLRYDDDFSYLKNNSLSNWYDRMKFLPLNEEKSSYLSFGGEVRYQYFNVTHEDWGDTAIDRDGYVLNRFLAHVDFHAKDYFRFFLQLQSSNASSRINPGLVEENPLDFHQAFFDIRFLNGSATQLIFRAGRQELSYGSQRMIAAREIPNNRSAFDAVKLIFNEGNFKTDLFYTHRVANKKGIFDDHFSKDVKFWGSYTVLKNVPFIHNFDLYYLGLWKKHFTYDDGSGRELRHSFGTRIWKNAGNWQYDFESVYQIGKLGSQNIRAWTISSNSTYQFKNTKMSPIIGLKTEMISGNKHYDDGTIETFNAPFARGAYFGLAALIGPSNLFDVHPSIDVDLTKSLNFSLDYDVFWRLSRNDGIYATNIQLLYSGRESNKKYIGMQYAGEMQYVVSNQLTLKLEGTFFKSGAFIKESSAGKNIVFGGATAQFKF